MDASIPNMDTKEPNQEPTQAYEVKIKKKNSHEATSKMEDMPHAVISFSTNSGPTPINYAPSSSLSKNEVWEMIPQAMNSFVKHQRLENEHFFKIYAKGHQSTIHVS